MARTVVGLDIGSSGVRAAEFSLGRRAPQLRRFGTVPLPQGVVRSGTVSDAEALADALRRLWTEGGFQTKEVALGVGNPGILVRQMDLEWMPPKEFRKALRYLVEGSLPMPVEDANLDHHLLEVVEVPGEGDDVRRVARILLVAAAREMVDGFVSAAQAASLRPVTVDIVPFALIRATCRASTAAAAPAEAIIDIGADIVTIVVHEGGQPRYVRTLAGQGGEPVTAALQERYDWSWEDAERTKIAVGLPGHADAAEVARLGGGLDHPAQRVVSAETEALVTEIAATLDYARGSMAEPAGLARVLLAGAASRLGGLSELLQERLGVAVEPLRVDDRVRTRRRLRLAERDVPGLVVPAGLCLGASS